MQTICYVLEECLAQLEQDGYNFDTSHVVLEANVQILSESQWQVGVGMVQGCEGVGDISGV